MKNVIFQTVSMAPQNQYPVQVRGDETVDEIKQQFEQVTQIPAYYQRHIIVNKKVIKQSVKPTFKRELLS